jgi:hypothetical protein
VRRQNPAQAGHRGQDIGRRLTASDVFGDPTSSAAISMVR